MVDSEKKLYAVVADGVMLNIKIVLLWWQVVVNVYETGKGRI